MKDREIAQFKWHFVDYTDILLHVNFDTMSAISFGFAVLLGIIQIGSGK